MFNDFNEKKAFDVIIVGEGIAGLATAYYLPESMQVLVVSKATSDVSSTWLAQGGVAASISKFDSPESHFQDTLAAGDGLCDPVVTRIVVNEGRERIVEMIQLGVPFERIDDEFDLAREGGHSLARILHYGDQTGRAIVSTLRKHLASREKISFVENFFFEQLVMHEEKVAGIIGYADNSSEPLLFLAPAIVIATGGASQMFNRTTNPITATGDGIAAGFRAGVIVSDMEFVQFHPTVLKDERIPMLLITEAARGRGARLLTPDGEPFMEGYHILEDLAPRFVVVRRMAELMLKHGYDYFLLDMRHFNSDDFSHISFVYSELKKRGFNPESEPIPVVPAAHYFIGGLKVDLYGRTNVPGLYACGEASCTGLHGANRLASNSLLEGLVFGKRIAESISSSLPKPGKVKQSDLRLTAKRGSGSYAKEADKQLKKLKRLMDSHAGIIRHEDGLKEAQLRLEAVYPEALEFIGNNRLQAEFYNLILVSKLVVEMALHRKESRGVHLRLDYPEKDDVHFKFRQEARRGES
jgi:L-aspartate oxidase